MATREVIELEDGSRRYKYKIRRRLPDGRILTRVKQFSTDNAGKRWSRRLEAQIDAGTIVREPENPRQRVGNLIERYRRDGVPSYGPKEQKRRRTRLSWWEKHLKTVRLAALRRSHLLELIPLLERAEGTPSGRPLTAATRRRYIAAIQHVLSVAIHWAWLETSPATRLARLGKDQEPPGRVRFLSDTERDHLLEICAQQPECRLAPLVKLAILTGCRQGEWMGLRWGDIEGQRRQLALVGDDGTRRTKNREGRSIALTQSAVAVLKQLHRDRNPDSNLVFANRHGKATFPRDAFDKAVREAEIENFRFHDLRHTFARYLLMSGASLAELAEALGHKTLSMVKRYAHLSRSHAASVVDRMEARLEGGGFG